MSYYKDIGICFVCGDECNPSSQTCGMCARQLTGFSLGWNPYPKTEQPEETKDNSLTTVTPTLVIPTIVTSTNLSEPIQETESSTETDSDSSTQVDSSSSFEIDSP